ncbi:Oidioi.mRNA.OKI2018_I69.XSR.g15305.t1.cds [Oikopleura dioica]|uniref:Oidioi.mRNA.OKI2018_I69.XSR.g15305.t1.cds n=1 Tax=Oikopleura dioica TaxID=34765 RepID=A0ABN7SLJ7_OIKDI|nr:Oidioi.mRNA.OKI2018_I69.XSR.g15305.t1.cds [Oikopleura dioica]
MKKIYSFFATFPIIHTLLITVKIVNKEDLKQLSKFSERFQIDWFTRETSQAVGKNIDMRIKGMTRVGNDQLFSIKTGNIILNFVICLDENDTIQLGITFLEHESENDDQKERSAGAGSRDRSEQDAKVRTSGSGSGEPFDLENDEHTAQLLRKIDFEDYKDWSAFRDWLFLLMRAKSSKSVPVNATIMGLTFEERELFIVRIGPNFAPKIVLECGIHGREWLSRKRFNSTKIVQ